MMEGVVLGGTGKKAILDGYSSAGKTGTAQKIDAATGRYSKSHYIASFGGFAPVNNPAVTVLVVLDSPVGLHEGGQVSAPVFSRVAQQVLAYLNVPHDVELQDPQRLMLRAKAKDADVAEGSPDRIVAEAEPTGPVQPLPATSAPALQKPVKLEISKAAVEKNIPPVPVAPAVLPQKGTVVLDVVGGVVVPDFAGKPLRAALEEAEAAGIELDISGSGVGREQSPAAGSKVPHGGHVTVRFAR
jgi:cell division protein FtsI (penicillin-binding protein 3)